MWLDGGAGLNEQMAALTEQQNLLLRYCMAHEPGSRPMAVDMAQALESSKYFAPKRDAMLRAASEALYPSTAAEVTSTASASDEQPVSLRTVVVSTDGPLIPCDRFLETGHARSEL